MNTRSVKDYEIGTQDYKPNREFIKSIIKEENRNKGSKYFRGRPEYNLSHKKNK